MLQLTQPSSIIDQTLANQRRALFLEKKKAVLDGLIGYKKELDHLTYSVPVFLEVLHFLVEQPGRCSGWRVYFASQLWSENDPGSRFIPEGQEENLTLIFVPTEADQPNGTTIQRDDLDNCFIISHDRLIRLPNPREVAPGMNTASNWVKLYQKKLPALALDGAQVTGNGGFRDTTCQWYKIGIFLDNPTTKTNGLIRYIENVRDDLVNPLVAIRPLFACYTETDTCTIPDGNTSASAGTDVPLYYQLTVLFELRQKNDPDPNPAPVIFAMRHRADDVKRAAVAQAVVPAPPAAVAGAAGAGAGADDSDTGYPCPPALNCNGGLLP
jgi:hypothetical protein